MYYNPEDVELFRMFQVVINDHLDMWLFSPKQRTGTVENFDADRKIYDPLADPNSPERRRKVEALRATFEAIEEDYPNIEYAPPLVEY